MTPLNQPPPAPVPRQPARILVAMPLPRSCSSGLSLFAEFIANDKLIVMQYHGSVIISPCCALIPKRHSAATFKTEADYRDAFY